MLSEKEKIKTEKEIEYSSAHQDLDKFNYNVVSSRILSFIALFVSMLSILSNAEIPNWSWVNWVKIIALLALFGGLIYFIELLRKEPKQHNFSFMAREEMIKHRYAKLGVNKGELSKEFEEIKKIMIESGRDLECREGRIEKYYLDKEKL